MFNIGQAKSAPSSANGTTPVAGRAGATLAGLEVISKLPSEPRNAPPLLFVHGAWHGAWCWDEYFLDHFAANGFAAHAVSLRGHGASAGRKKLRATRARDFVADIAAVAESLPSPPILIGHSMGGFLIQKYLETRSAPAAVLLASVAPTGVWRTLLRTMRDQPLDVLKSNLSLSLWPVISTAAKARRLMFSPSVPMETIERYHAQMQDEAWFAYLDSLVFDLARPRRVTTPMVVMGGTQDMMIRPGEVAATAKAYGVAPIMFDGMAHDLMLDTRWRNVANEIIAQLYRRFQQTPALETSGLKVA
jgi:pimeloyl-ACP methyl ester carboxylesterase